MLGEMVVVHTNVTAGALTDQAPSYSFTLGSTFHSMPQEMAMSGLHQRLCTLLAPQRYSTKLSAEPGQYFWIP